ncbi:MAG TPA: glycosyltransferase, partial [Blastocatellia bacterium]
MNISSLFTHLSFAPRLTLWLAKSQSICFRLRAVISYSLLMDADTLKPADSTARSVSVVIPLLDERPTIEELHSRLSAVLRESTRQYEIIFVDDGSRDGSIEAIKKLHALDPAVRYIRFRRNFGKSAALAAGFRAARFSIVATMDADLQDLPEELPRLIDELENYD